MDPDLSGFAYAENLHNPSMVVLNALSRTWRHTEGRAPRLSHMRTSGHRPARKLVKSHGFRPSGQQFKRQTGGHVAHRHAGG